MRSELVPEESQILEWIERIFARGVRRPGYPADRWTEEFVAQCFRELGLEDVRLEPAPLPYWEPRSWSLQVTGTAGELELPCFPLPHSAPTEGLELELAAWDPAAPAAVAGKASLCDVSLLRLPPAAPVAGGQAVDELSGDLGIGVSPGGRIFDPRNSFDGAQQVLPFGAQIQLVMEPAIEAGAAAFIGTLTGYPGDSFEYYVPYDGVSRPIPGLWIRGSDGFRLRAMLADGPVRVRIHVDSVREEITCYNVVGELPGADEELVVIGSHHDGPWSSAVEDASGVALVLAQATYWSKLTPAERPHRLMLLVNAGHMVGGAGCQAFIEARAEQVQRIVLEIHLEHAAREFVERDGELVPSGEPETRWFFTSRNPALESAVADSLKAEQLERSLIIAPDVFGDRPTTDGGLFHIAGVPLVNYLTAPFYLFDRIDEMDKIDVPSLVPVTRAAIRWVEFTAGTSAATMRSGVSG